MARDLQLGCQPTKEQHGLAAKNAGGKSGETYMAYKITDKCESCGSCQDECPQGAITSGSPFKIDADACIDCGACASACPANAIVSD